MGAVSILEKSVIQANPLVRARKKMNLTELRLFILGLQDIKSHIKDENFYDVDFHTTVITHKELVDLFGNTNNGNIENLKKQVEKAYTSTIKLSYKDGGFGFRHIYKKMDYLPQEGLVIQFDDEIKPYILEVINQPYTKYKVKAFFSLSSVYAWRILESLLEKHGYLEQGYKEIFLALTIEEVRFRLNIPNGLYEGKICNFRSRVLDLPINEINEKTDYQVRYEVQKRGRKVTGFKFFLRLKEGAMAEIEEQATEPINPMNSPTEGDITPLPIDNYTPLKDKKEKIIAAMIAEGMTKAAINTWLRDYGVDGAIASWQLAIERADKKSETKAKGYQRKKYLKWCMENNIAAIVTEERQVKQEIIDREKKVKNEKKIAAKKMAAGFKSIGLDLNGKGNDPQSFSNFINKNSKKRTDKNEQQGLSENDVKLIVENYKKNNYCFDDAMINKIEKYGFTPNTFMIKHFLNFL